MSFVRRHGSVNVIQRALLTVGVLYLGACEGDTELLRGEVSDSPDGKTYFGVLDDNGGACGPLLVDGKLWPHAIGEVVPFTPGIHTIKCGFENRFTIPPGVVYKFNYWGP